MAPFRVLERSPAVFWVPSHSIPYEMIEVASVQEFCLSVWPRLEAVDTHVCDVLEVVASPELPSITGKRNTPERREYTTSVFLFFSWGRYRPSKCTCNSSCLGQNGQFSEQSQVSSSGLHAHGVLVVKARRDGMWCEMITWKVSVVFIQSDEIADMVEYEARSKMDFGLRKFEICVGIQSATWISRVRNPKTKSKFFSFRPSKYFRGASRTV